MKSNKIFWASFFIITAVLLLISQLGYLGGINFVSIILTIIIAAIAIKSIATRNVSVFMFSIAFLCIIYSEPLGLEKITPWPVLGAALLISIGLSMLIKPRHRRSHRETNFTERVEKETGSNVYCDTQFASTTKYVDSDDFQRADINCKFGGVKIYFDRASVREGNAEITVDVSFGGVELYVPKEWIIENNINAFAGGVEEKNRNIPTGNIRINLNGNVNFGEITIIYV
jgi:predicted membrane protein